MFSRITPKYWSLLILLAWGGSILALELLRLNSFGLDEGAARALLLNWSVSDQITTPVVMHGSPDFRALLFIPLGLYWPGSILAAKVFTLLVMFAATMLFYQWSKTHYDDETSLIASGLLLIAPLTLTQIDSINTGPFLLLMFGLGMLIDKRYRNLESAINGWYFVQLLTIATTITLHPIGLAYPIALAWNWFKNPMVLRRRNQVFIGITITASIITAMQVGWVSIHWLQNPLQVLSHYSLGGINEDINTADWSDGLIPAMLLLAVVVFNAKKLFSSLLGSMLVSGVLIGLFAADASWGLLALTLVLYSGIPLLIKLNQSFKLHNFFAQRGLVLITVFITALIFMQMDKAYAQRVKAGLFSPIDQLIQNLTIDSDNPDTEFQAASQWPGKTMIITKRDVLPLPPGLSSAEEFLTMTKGVTHMIFDQNTPQNTELASRIAGLSSHFETIALQKEGVVVRLKAGTSNSHQATANQKQPAGQTHGNQ